MRKALGYPIRPGQLRCFDADAHTTYIVVEVFDGGDRCVVCYAGELVVWRTHSMSFDPVLVNGEDDA